MLTMSETCRLLWVVHVLVSCARLVTCVDAYWADLRLPDEHLHSVLHSDPALTQLCRADTHCPYKAYLDTERCWGYEEGCEEENRLHTPRCPEPAPEYYGSSIRKPSETQWQLFYRLGDFGYVKEFKDELQVFCKPQDKHDSLLLCSKLLRYCRAVNIYIDFSKIVINRPKIYHDDLFRPGDIGGHCVLDENKLRDENAHRSKLQSWAAELEQYTTLDFQPTNPTHCDLMIDTPTYIIKLDMVSSIYHHFCDFVNLYASLHMNGTFSLDINIFIWEPTQFNRGGLFAVMWQAFSRRPLIYMADYLGKRVCFKDAIFSLLARMRLGLYYNAPVVPGCHSSGLFRAFAHHILYRLNVTQNGPLQDKIRVTLLARSTKYRNILNQKEIEGALRKREDLHVEVVDYKRSIPFLQQLQRTHNSDVFVGIHGAGLTHLLFQPDWGALFEIYNCGDFNCYKDLANLRGVRYFTWERQEKLFPEDEGHHPTLGAHAKFTNYAFDVDEFLRIVDKAVEHVRGHPSYVRAWQAKYNRPYPRKHDEHQEL